MIDEMKKKTVEVSMVSAPRCSRCQKVVHRLFGCATAAGVAMVLTKLDSSSQDAVNLGIKFGLDDVPSFVIGKKAFCGTDFKDSDVEQVMKEFI